ncbi:hypothetical protein Rvan_0433 [Rhodomicrobium vannielii ATCC 17100]|uniref:ATP-grasp domain-containing protein n=1 Tax=Rhodomicrobium vannielii (strain ATCC 17100 / DSM 162 / LMG 4299 / NCIMB 10020 / ATH 3.1.1) TaxID=648757 RepID=E3I891_RHOVT|nr:hypothetical protein [Rhodomicrobium vannielii]ADP69716.1 hypothetical protein Rvan_0433 [Rhodomicrobium vannielii ATCC 17100]
MTVSQYKRHRKYARFLFDRARYLSQISTRRNVLSFSHGFPSSGHVMVKICDALNIRISNTLLSPGSATIFFPLTDDIYPRQPDHFINGRCTNIDKDVVADYQLQAFGYGYTVDPLNVTGHYVRKSIRNAAHDGCILYEPEIPKHGFFYQKLICTEVGDEVEEIRVLVIGTVLDICYLKRHPLSERFAIPSNSVQILPTRSLLSQEEVDAICRMCAMIGMEYGEIDVMRDRNNGLAYVIDMNRTPGGPPIAFTRSERDGVVKRLAEAFTSEFGKRILDI